MLSIIFWGSFIGVFTLILQKWVRLSKTGAFSSSYALSAMEYSQSFTQKVFDVVSDHLPSRRIGELFRSSLDVSTEYAQYALDFVLSHAQRIHSSLDEFAQRKYRKGKKGATSFFLKHMSEHKKQHRNDKKY